MFAELLRELAAKIERAEHIDAALDSILKLQGNIMALTDDLKSAAERNAAAVTALDAKVDALLTSQKDAADKLTAALAADAIDHTAVQQAIDTLNASTDAATAEAKKVDDVLTPAQPEPAPEPMPTPVNTAPVETAPVVPVDTMPGEPVPTDIDMTAPVEVPTTSPVEPISDTASTAVSQPIEQAPGVFSPSQPTT